MTVQISIENIDKMKKQSLYNYRLLEWRTYDGDSILDVKVDYGMYRYEENVDLRLFGVDAPEIRRSKSQAHPDLEV